jgi:N-hydroxyarylamine O-acetyltransferase
MNFAAYLARIGYKGEVSPTIETLRELHRAHLFSVPFENLDISVGRQILCNEDAFVTKIVERHRGGFCYEMNGAFAALLRSIGFKVTLLSARVSKKNGSDGPEFDHLTLRVDLGEPWLADVGFGDSFLEPLRLEVGVKQEQFGRSFRVLDYDGSLHVERADAARSWERQYSFTLQPRALKDFEGMCHYHQTSADSHFTRKRLCTMATPEGRITLSEMKLILTRHGTKEERELGSEKERQTVLRQTFGVVL